MCLAHFPLADTGFYGILGFLPHDGIGPPSLSKASQFPPPFPMPRKALKCPRLPDLCHGADLGDVPGATGITKGTHEELAPAVADLLPEKVNVERVNAGSPCRHTSITINPLFPR